MIYIALIPVNCSLAQYLQQTTGLTQRKINITHLLSVGVIVAAKFIFCCAQVSLVWIQFLAQLKRE